MRDADAWPVRLARDAYLDGRITLPEFERALEDRLTADGFKHDCRIDGHLPSSVEPNNPRPYRVEGGMD